MSGTDELREAVAEWLFCLSNPARYWTADFIDRAPIYAEADALLAGPLAPLLAKVQAVEALAADFRALADDPGCGRGSWRQAEEYAAAALGGESRGEAPPGQRAGHPLAGAL